MKIEPAQPRASFQALEGSRVSQAEPGALHAVFRAESPSKECRQAGIPHKGGTRKTSRQFPRSWKRWRTFHAEKTEEM